jgi:hypothetical protein
MKLLQFLQDGTGAFSATRLGFLLWIIGAFVVWVINSLTRGKLAVIDQSVITIIAILMSGKVVQSFSEAIGNTGAAPAAPAPAAPAPNH